MIFVDASAVVAILGQEPDGADLRTRMRADPARYYSAIVRWEVVAALVKSYGYDPRSAALLADDFFQTFDFVLIDIGAHEAHLATTAYARYGRGRHPAALKLGDCFAYACAKSIGAELLYKGEDFSLTDLA